MILLPYRHIYITNNASLSTSSNQLLIRQEEEYTIPLEDISTVVIENKSVIISASALSKIAEYGIALYTCDDKHLPNGLLTSFNSHSRQLKVLNMQLSMSKPFQKRIWQKLIRQKIANQARCLLLCNKEGAQKIGDMVSKVESGDRTFIESSAAQYYFRYLYGHDFVRRKDDTVNSAMNYGYALLRGRIARSLCAFGFLPCLGLFHHDELNNFNLADDFIEPFRALIDMWVYQNVNDNGNGKGLTSEHKKGLYNIFNTCMLIDGGKSSTNSTIENMVLSFVTAISNMDAEYLKLPELIPLEMNEDD